MATIEVKTQAQLDAALKKANLTDIIVCVGSGYFEVDGSASVRAYDSASVRASGSASVRAYDSASVRASGSASVTASGSASVTASGSASVTASGSASVRAYGSASVTAYGSASVTAYDSASVTAYGSASVTAYDSASVTAYGSASVRAYDSASVRASGSASVRASKYVSVHTWKSRGKPKVSGGVLIEVPDITTAKDWCEYYGVEVKRGIAMLFKAVDDDFATHHSRAKDIFYRPGLSPAAPDWDPEPECGHGLHFSPRPAMALDFNPEASRFVACPVRLSDIVVHKSPMHPNKVKAPKVSGKCYEVDVHGDPLAEKVAA